jgi:UPF0271 protein
MRSSTDRSIDLNADVGEGPGEEPLYALITSANIACGGHAGDDATMREALTRALRHGVAVGAHPSYPDREGFGRVSMTLPPDALRRTIAEQIHALMRVAGSLGAPLRHVKPHGALYNDAASRGEIARVVGEAVLSVSSTLILVGLFGSPALDAWRDLGLRVASEGFADRAYDPSGMLVSRAVAGALISDPAAAAAQAVRLVAKGCDTVCVHADTPGASDILRAVRRALEASGLT